MTVTTTRARRGSAAGRRFGYVIGAGVNAVLLYLVNVSPGWQAAPLVTPDAAQVIPILNLSLTAGLIANLVYIVVDVRAVKALGDLITTSIALAVTVRVWQVFPFDVTSGWEVLIRAFLVLCGFGCAVAIIVQVVTLLRAITGTLR